MLWHVSFLGLYNSVGVCMSQLALNSASLFSHTKTFTTCLGMHSGKNTHKIIGTDGWKKAGTQEILLWKRRLVSDIRMSQKCFRWS